MVTVSVIGLEARMATEDKGGRSTEKASARSLEEKRLDTKAKSAAQKAGAGQSTDRAIGR